MLGCMEINLLQFVAFIYLFMLWFPACTWCEFQCFLNFELLFLCTCNHCCIIHNLSANHVNINTPYSTMIKPKRVIRVLLPIQSFSTQPLTIHYTTSFPTISSLYVHATYTTQCIPSDLCYM